MDFCKTCKTIKLEKLIVKTYIHLIRKATNKEKREWVKNYGHKLRNK